MLPGAACASLSAAQMAAIPGVSLSGMQPSCWVAVPGTTCTGLRPHQLAALGTDIAVLPWWCWENVQPQALAALSTTQLSLVSDRGVAKWSQTAW